MTAHPRTLSVVMPAYNEEASIEAAVRDVRTHVFSLLPDAELIVVDDGSRDRTGEILDRIAQVDSRVRVIHQANRGHGGALRTGMDAAEGDYLLLVDSDRQIPLSAFPCLWERTQGRDGAFGVRRVRRDPPIRLMLTRLVRLSLVVLFGVRLDDANIPFKILRRSVWMAARPLIPEDSLAPSLFLAVFMKKRGYDVTEQPVPHTGRAAGVVSIRRWRLLKFCTRGFCQLLVFRSRVMRNG